MLLSDDMNGLIYRIEYIGSDDGDKVAPSNSALVLAGAVRTQPFWWMACSALAGGAVTAAFIGLARLCGRRQPGSLLAEPLAVDYAGKDTV